MKLRWLACLLLIAPATAHAFSDPSLFAMPVAVGGGGGRYFTGSHADPYACSVCHAGGKAPEVTLSGVPDTLVAGTHYDLTVAWTSPSKPQGFQLELTLPDGAHPSVTVTPDAMLPPSSRCDSSPTGASAVYTFDVGMRRIVGVEDCGASQITVGFVATGQPIALAIAGVRGDGDGTAGGDGAYEKRLILGQHLDASSGGGCNAGGDAGALSIAAAAALAMAARRRRAR